MFCEKNTPKSCDSKNIYTVLDVKCNQQTLAEDSKYKEKHKNELVITNECISKKEPSKI